VRRLENVSRSPFGRSTRAIPAADLESKTHAFVKDYWTPDVEGLELNVGGIYRKLRQHSNVQNIATFYCGIDIRSQATITQSCGDQADGPPQALEGSQHYRMALLDVGRPLTMFKSTCEMINAIADAMEGKQKFLLLCVVYDTELPMEHSPPGCI
jgi:hypothetical protein